MEAGDRGRRNPPPLFGSKVAFFAALGLAYVMPSTACMVVPRDGDSSDEAYAGQPIAFSGFHLAPDAVVRLRAIDPTTGQWTLWGPQTYSVSTSVFSLYDEELYGWSLDATIPRRFWKPGLGGVGHRALIGAVTDGPSGNVEFVTFEKGADILGCANSYNNLYDFLEQCGSTNSPMAMIKTSDYQALKGATSCPWLATDCNVCLNDVPGAFARVRVGDPTTIPLIISEIPYPPNNDPIVYESSDFYKYSHFQGMARLPNRIDHAGYSQGIVVMSRSGSPGALAEPEIHRTGLYFFEMGPEFAQPGGDLWYYDWDAAYPDSPEPDEWIWYGGMNYYYEYWEPGLNHISSMQALGTTLAVSFEHSGSNPQPGQVRFFDAGDITNVRELNRLVLDGSRGEERQGGSSIAKTTAVAVAKLATGSYLMFVGGYSNVSDGWFYISSTQGSLKSANWNYINYWSRYESDGIGGHWGNIQNLNFVTECETGDIYLIAMGGLDGGEIAGTDSHGFLYRVVEGGDGALDLQWVSSRDFTDTNEGAYPFGGVSMRFGAQAFVTKNHANLLFYASGRNYEKIWFDDDTVYADQWGY